MFKVFGLVVVIVAVVAGVFFYRGNGTNNTSNETLLQRVTAPLGAPATPMPFSDMTIPTLRARKYESSLGGLQNYSENSQFSSYLTNYTSDGLKVNGLLTIPKGDEPKAGWPAIVFVHGYIAPTIYRTTERYSDYVNYLARNGFVVFKIDLRGHGNSEGEPGGAYYSPDYVVDTLNAYAALQSADFVNSKAVGLWGHSMAGNVTFRSLVAKQDVPAVVIWAGAGFTYADLRDYRIMDNSYRPPTQPNQSQRRRQQMFETYGDFNNNHEFWKQIVPTNYLNGVSGALSLHHAVNDDVVSVEYSRNLVKVLSGSPIQHEFFEYPSGGHNLEGSAFGQAMQRTVDFYKRYLK